MQSHLLSSFDSLAPKGDAFWIPETCTLVEVGDHGDHLAAFVQTAHEEKVRAERSKYRRIPRPNLACSDELFRCASDVALVERQFPERDVRAAASITLLVSSCFNVTSPDGPPHAVEPPTVKCTVPTPPDASCDGSSDSDAMADDASSDDASTPIVVGGCDAGPPSYQYNECALPPSTCADSHWAAYFDDGICVQGYCQLTTKYHYCPGGCAGGYCITGGSGSTLARRGF
jgi:hypothetical protein